MNNFRIKRDNKNILAFSKKYALKDIPNVLKSKAEPINSARIITKYKKKVKVPFSPQNSGWTKNSARPQTRKSGQFEIENSPALQRSGQRLKSVQGSRRAKVFHSPRISSLVKNDQELSFIKPKNGRNSQAWSNLIIKKSPSLKIKNQERCRDDIIPTTNIISNEYNFPSSQYLKRGSQVSKNMLQSSACQKIFPFYRKTSKYENPGRLQKLAIPNLKNKQRLKIRNFLPSKTSYPAQAQNPKIRSKRMKFSDARVNASEIPEDPIQRVPQTPYLAGTSNFAVKPMREEGEDEVSLNMFFYQRLSC
ncbi:unnamed protein product [Moneuplotes crassus]|uniref:Uncharacterized protein n=1 Tax=Euplotes crassus TaxID=5936 RepID=A0AAD1U746_EUPCR|nr:unnamed protein product [Moneuplotes crassus]